MRKIITFGTFDVIHVGHIRLLQRARLLGDHLTVGVSSDTLNFAKKHHASVYPESERMEIVSSIAFVDEVFREDSLELKRHYIEQHQADVLVMGNDWEGKFDMFRPFCEVIYLPRTMGISTTQILAEIRKYD